MTKITRAEIMETKLRERAGFMREAGHNDDADLDEEAANLIQSLRVSAALEPQQEEAVAEGSDQAAIEIADAVIGWMVKYDLLDADLEYRDDDIIEVLDDLAPTPAQKVQESQTVSVTDAMVEKAMEAFAIVAHDLTPAQYTATRNRPMSPGGLAALNKSVAAIRAALTAALESTP